MASPQCAEALASLQAAQDSYAAEEKQRFRPPAGACKDVSGAVRQLFAGACAALEREHAALLAKEQSNNRTLTSR